MPSVQNRTFLGTLAAAIVAFCKTFIRSMAVVEDVVAMGEKSISVARKKQTVDLAIDMNDYATRTINAAAMRQVRQELDNRAFINNDPEKQALMDKAKETINKLVLNDLAELSVKEDE